MFSPLYITINGVDVEWKPEDYFYYGTEERNVVCLAILSLNASGHSYFILGANWMKNRDIVFNLKEGEISIYDNMKC